MATLERAYEIQEVAELTGLSSARLRAWERRHELVRPRRMPNGYRAYTADQVALLRAYARLTEAGERIGELAQEPVETVLARAEHRELDGTPLVLSWVGDGSVALDIYPAPPDPEVSHRAHLVLLLAEGYSWSTIAAVLFTSPSTIARWQQRFHEGGLAASSFENVPKRRRYFLCVGFVEHADAGEPFYPRNAASDVVFEQPPVETK